MRWRAFVEGTIPIWVYQLTTLAALSIIAAAFAGLLKGQPADWLEKYQTLLTGFIAAGAGYAAWRGAQGQIAAARYQAEQVSFHEQDRLKRQACAARAVLPLALDGICDYATACLDALRTTRPFDELQGLVPIQLPELPPDLIKPLQECILYAEPDRAIEIAHLIAVIQVQRARLRPLTNLTGATQGYRQAQFQSAAATGVIDAADVYLRAVALFDWARGFDEQELTYPSAQALHSLLGPRFLEVEWPEVHARIKARQNTEEARANRANQTE